jgi:hypothetical protein
LGSIEGVGAIRENLRSVLFWYTGFPASAYNNQEDLGILPFFQTLPFSTCPVDVPMGTQYFQGIRLLEDTIWAI